MRERAETPAAPARGMIPPRPLCIPNRRQDRWYALERLPSKIMEARALNARANRKGAGAFSEEGSHLGQIKPQRIPLRRRRRDMCRRRAFYARSGLGQKRRRPRRALSATAFSLLFTSAGTTESIREQQLSISTSMPAAYAAGDGASSASGVRLGRQRGQGDQRERRAGVCPADRLCKSSEAICTESSGDFLPPSPPAEKASARQDQAGNASTGDGAGDASGGVGDAKVNGVGANRALLMMMMMMMMMIDRDGKLGVEAGKTTRDRRTGKNV